MSDCLSCLAGRPGPTVTCPDSTVRDFYKFLFRRRRDGCYRRAMQRPIVRTKPVHAKPMMNIGRAVWIEANGHSYRLWHTVTDYDELEAEAQRLADDIGADYLMDPNWVAEAS